MDITGTQEEGYEKKEKYKNYVILGIGEGGGYTSSGTDLPISRFGSVKNKVEQGATYLSIDKIDELIKKHPRTILWNKILRLLHLQSDNLSKISHRRFKKYLGNISQFKSEYSMVSRDFMVGDMVRLPLGDNSVNEIWLENVLSLIEKGQEIIIKELLRVLKRRGRIYVIEYYTPKKIKKYLEEYDFLKDGAEIKIYSGGEMFIKMSSEGLSKDDLRKVAFHCTNMERDGVASIIDVFLAEITKNN